MSFLFAQRTFATAVNVWTPTVILELGSPDHYRRGYPNLHGIENAADRSDSPAQQSLQLAPPDDAQLGITIANEAHKEVVEHQINRT